MAKVLALVSFKIFPPHMGGQKGVAFFYKYLGLHHDVLLVASKDNALFIESNYEVHSILYANKKMPGNIFVLPALTKLIRLQKIDCIIAEHSYTGWLAYLLKKLMGKPFIIHSHNIEWQRFQQMKRKGWGLYRSYEKWIHRKADHNFFISEEDKESAIKYFHLKETACSVIPYGIEAVTGIVDAKVELKKRLNINADYIFYFNGTLDYKPNIEAVEVLLNNVNPLLQQTGLNYRILISGKRLPQQQQEKISATSEVIYLHFVEDVEALYQGSDLFLNTVVNSSGVKTKLIEALANNCTVVSTNSGASGLPQQLFQNKVLLSNDHDWVSFVKNLLIGIKQPIRHTPEPFFSYFSWSHIAAKAAESIASVSIQHV